MSVLSPMDPPASPVDRVFAQGVYHIVWSGYSYSTLKGDSEKIGGTAPRALESTCRVFKSHAVAANLTRANATGPGRSLNLPELWRRA